MNAEERFEKWWQQHGHNFIDSPEFKAQRIAWLACEAARDAEIDRVATELERRCMNEEIENGRTSQYHASLAAARLVRCSLLPTQPKEGD